MKLQHILHRHSHAQSWTETAPIRPKRFGANLRRAASMTRLTQMAARRGAPTKVELINAPQSRSLWGQPASSGGRPYVGGRSVGLAGTAQWLVFAMIALLTVQRDDLSVIQIALGSTRISELLALGAISVVLLNAAVTSGRSFRASTGITWAFLIFFAVLFLSSFLSAQIHSGINVRAFVRRPDREVPFLKSYTTMLSWSLGVAAFYAITLTVNTPALLRRALKWWVVGGAVCSAIAIYSAPATVFGWPFGNTIGVSARGAAVSGAEDMLPRVYGLTGEPRHLVTFLVSLLPLLLLTRVSNVTVMNKKAQDVCLGLCALAFLLTFSRSTVAYGVAMVGLVLFFGSIGKRHVNIPAPIKTILVILGFSVPTAVFVQLALVLFHLPDLWTILRLQLDSMTSADANLSNWFQAIGWEVAWAAFRDHPLFGVGIGNLSFYVDQYIGVVPQPTWLPDLQYFVITPVNNVYLDLLSETGVLGLVAFCILIGTICRSGWRANRVAAPRGRAVISGLLCGVLMLLIAFVFFSAFNFAYVWASLAFLFVASRFVLSQPNCFEPWAAGPSA
jgi:O-antigen ligase